MDPTTATEIETEFILDIGKRFSSLWIIGEGGYDRGKFLDAVFRIHLRACGVGSTKLKLIRG
jgi:hypothetical protein